jgi:hypothetical protein
MTELEEVDEIPDSAIDNGSSQEWVEEDRIIVKWMDDDGTLYTEEYVREGPPRKAVEEDD